MENHRAQSSDEEMYKENILDHYREPHNVGRLSSCSLQHKELNQSCGDTIELFIVFDKEDRVVHVAFEGQGCAISQAAVSMLTDHIRGMHIDDLRKLTQEDIFRLLGVEIGMSRLKCALLGLKTLHHGLDNMKK